MVPPLDEKSTIEHFQSIDWTARILSNPLYQLSSTRFQTPKDDTEDAFIAITLATPQTIQKLLPLQLRKLPSPDSVPKRPSADSVNPENASVIWLVTISAEGMSGFPNVLHGGAIATIFDECLSNMMGAYRDAAENADIVLRTDDRGPIMTAKLEITYKRAVMLPGTYAVKTWVSAFQDRPDKRAKLWLQGEFVDKKGRVCAEGKGVWVELRPANL